MPVQTTTDFNPTDVGLEARAFVWMLQFVQEVLGATIFVPCHAVTYVTTPVYFIFLVMLVNQVKHIFSSSALLQGSAE
jgi:hypothetical protein